MFLTCPHCGYLVAIAAARKRCPRCDSDLKTGEIPESPSASSAVKAPEQALPQAQAKAQTGESEPALRPEQPNPSASATTSDANANASSVSPHAQTRPLPPIRPDSPVAHPTVVPAPRPTVAGIASRTADTLSNAPQADHQQSTKSAHPAPPSAPTPIAETSNVPPVTATSKKRIAPSFVAKPATQAEPAARVRWRIAAIVGLSALLGLQLLLASRAQLAGEARWRPLLTVLCNTLKCTLPPWHEPSAFALADRNVQPHSTVPGVLRVTATFRNQASWPQAWPILVLNLSEADGRIAGARAFTPAEYLGAAPTQNTIASGQSASIAMDVIEPSKQAIAFDFQFR